MTFAAKTVVIVGGGFSGAIFGLKLHRKCPEWRIVIAEPRKRLRSEEHTSELQSP